MKRLLFNVASPALLLLAGLPSPPAHAATTPDCVTRAEFRAIKVDSYDGMLIRRVHRIFDSYGRQSVATDWQGPYQNWRSQQRIYDICDNDQGYVLVTFGQARGGPWIATWKSADWDGS